jgi:hypothetical protein
MTHDMDMTTGDLCGWGVWQLRRGAPGAPPAPSTIAHCVQHVDALRRAPPCALGRCRARVPQSLSAQTDAACPYPLPRSPPLNIRRVVLRHVYNNDGASMTLPCSYVPNARPQDGIVTLHGTDFSKDIMEQARPACGRPCRGAALYCTALTAGLVAVARHSARQN